MKVGGILGKIYDTLDFPIRYLYCRLPFLNKLLFWKLYSSDFKNLDKEFEEMRKQLTQKGFNFKGKVCLELGPGNSYINAYNFLMLGAKKVILVDKYPRFIKTKRQRAVFMKECEYIKNKYGKELFFIKNGGIDSKYVKVITGDIAQLDVEDKVDFAYSISVFEHIKNVEGTISKLSKILKKGGLMYHSIDLRDHYNFNNPFLFYKYSDKVWNKYLTREGVSYTNRIRKEGYIALFKKAKFRVIHTKSFLSKISNNQENEILKIIIKK